MRIIVTADFHHGYPGRIDDTMWAMQAISDYAKVENIEKIVVLGDFHHNHDHITIDVWNRISAFLEEDRKHHEWIIFPGNHDMFMKTSWDINSIRPLRNLITAVNDISALEFDGRRFVIVPFMHYESAYMDVLKQVENDYGPDDVLLTHIGVKGAALNTCFLLQHWSVVTFVDSRFPLILTGHFHCHQIVEDKVCYPGSPIPFRFDEGVVPHGFLDVETNELQVNFIDMRELRDDCPRDFITVTDDWLSSIDESSIRGNCVRVALSREYSKTELEEIRNVLREHGSISTHWMKAKERDPESIQAMDFEASNIPIFERWLKEKKPTDYDISLLKKLNQQVVELGNELIVQSDDGEAE